MSDDESMNFFAEFESLVTSEPFRRSAIVLMSGDRYDVLRDDQLLPLKTMYIDYPSGGGSVIFPFPNLCAIEIYPDQAKKTRD